MSNTTSNSVSIDSFYGEVQWSSDLQKALTSDLVALSTKYKISRDILMTKITEILNPEQMLSQRVPQRKTLRPRDPNDPFANRGKRWTDDEDKTMNKMLKSKTPLQEVAKELKRTEKSILSRLANQYANRYPESTLSEIIKKEGLKLNEYWTEKFDEIYQTAKTRQSYRVLKVNSESEEKKIVKDVPSGKPVPQKEEKKVVKRVKKPSPPPSESEGEDSDE